MPNVKTTTLSGTETKVTLPQNYPYCFITNMSEAEIYASGNPGVIPYADGVYTIPAGTEIRISPEASGDTLWLLGSGKVQIRGEEIAAPTSFKRSVKGGEISFSGDYNDLTNKPDIPVPSEVIDSNSTNKTVSTSKAVFDYVAISDNTALASANSYTDTAIANLVGTAPDTLNTLEELAAAVQNNETVVEALDSAITNKADKASLSAHTDNKNNPHEVKPLQIKKDDLVLHRGKTVAEFKSELLNWWNSACGTLSVYRFSGGTVPWWLENFKNDEEIIPAGATYTIIPVADYAPDKRHATFLFSAASNSKGSNEILKLELFNGQFVYLSKLVDLSDYATIEQLNGKQDIITKPPITDNSVDWNTLTKTSIYPVGIQNGEGLSDSSTHGLSSAYHYGFLIVIARLNYNGWLYQLYISNRSEVYIRSLYTSWSSWTRIDGRVTGIKGESETEYRKGNVNISQSNIGLIFDGLFLKNKTVGEAKEIIINTYLSNSNKFGVFMKVPNDIIYNWNTDDYVLKAGSLCQITPIGTVTKGTLNNKLYGRFLISDYEYSSQNPSPIYTFVVLESVVKGLSKILTSDDVTSEMIEKLKNL